MFIKSPLWVSTTAAAAGFTALRCFIDGSPSLPGGVLPTTEAECPWSILLSVDFVSCAYALVVFNIFHHSCGYAPIVFRFLHRRERVNP
jgi:hypothetical protein